MSNATELLAELRLSEPGAYPFDGMANLIGQLLRHATNEVSHHPLAKRPRKNLERVLQSYECDAERIAASYRLYGASVSRLLSVEAGRISIALSLDEEAREFYSPLRTYKAELWMDGIAQWHNRESKLFPGPFGISESIGKDYNLPLSDSKCQFLMGQVEDFTNEGEMILRMDG